MLPHRSLDSVPKFEDSFNWWNDTARGDVSLTVQVMFYTDQRIVGSCVRGIPLAGNTQIRVGNHSLVWAMHRLSCHCFCRPEPERDYAKVGTGSEGLTARQSFLISSMGHSEHLRVHQMVATVSRT